MNGNPIGGSPMVDGPFAGNNFNFDITGLTIISPPYPVPVPAAFWLFGSGLALLLGATRRCARS